MTHTKIQLLILWTMLMLLIGALLGHKGAVNKMEQIQTNTGITKEPLQDNK